MMRKFKTAADFMAAGACPLLIMGLLWTLLFFLLDAVYGGGWKGALQWTMFWFVLAMTLVSRIAIVRTPGLAIFYGAVLAAVTSMLLLQYVGGRWSVFLFLGLIWWAAHKLTFDCTLIDDEDKTSGQGLLRAGKVDAAQRKDSSAVRAANPLKRPPPRPKAEKKKKVIDQKVTEETQVHTPGVWILYFSLGAIPLFGLGEMFLETRAERVQSFYYLAIYLGCALGLLLLTSFLGLRRYLRQRFLEMPARMSAAWVGKGFLIIAGLFVLSFLLPRPATPYSLAGVITKIKSPDQNAADLGSVFEEGAEGQSKAKTQSPDAPADANPSGEPIPAESGERKMPEPSVETPSMLDQTISWALLWLILMILAWKFRRQLLEWLAGLLASLREFFSSKERAPTGLKKPRLADHAKKIVLQNPFASGREPDLATLVRQTYEGLQVWAEQKGFGAPEHETPLEFSERLAAIHPGLRSDLLKLARSYSHLAYANEAPQAETRASLQSIWFVMVPRLAARG